MKSKEYRITARYIIPILIITLVDIGLACCSSGLLFAAIVLIREW